MIMDKIILIIPITYKDHLAIVEGNSFAPNLLGLTH
jgi:hypothetical protein